MQERKDEWTVGQWMSTNPRTVEPGDSVRSAFYTMRSEGYRHLLVAERGELIGIVTDRDLRRPDLTSDAEGWNDYYQLDDDTEVRHVMTGKVRTLGPGDSLEKALRQFIEHKIGGMPVLDKKGQIIGILTTYDLLRSFEAALGSIGGLLRLGQAS